MIKKLWPYFDAAIIGNHYAEPFAGGGSTFLHVACHRPELKISINDKDADVAHFWSIVCGCDAGFRRLCGAVERSRESMDDPHRRLEYWHQLRGCRPDDPALAAFRFLFLNKTCWGGQVDASPMGGYEQNGWKGRGDRGLACQYDVDTILANLCEARQCLAGRTSVTNLDVFEFLHVVNRATFYFDPPYFPGRDNRLYRQGMTKSEHDHLAAVLREFPHPWVLSYDNSSAVRQLYDWANIVEIPMRSSHRPGPQNWKTKIELLILPAMPNATGRCIQSDHGKIIPSAAAALSSLNVMESINASHRMNMNNDKHKSSKDNPPMNGSQGSREKTDWNTAKFSTKELHLNEVGKIRRSLTTLEEGNSETLAFKEALDYMWERHFRRIAQSREAFCEMFRLTVPQADALVTSYRLYVATKAAAEKMGLAETQHLDAPKSTSPGVPLESTDNSATSNSTEPPDHDPQKIQEHERDAEKRGKARTSKARSTKKENEKKRASTPTPDQGVQSADLGVESNTNPREEKTTEPAKDQKPDVPSTELYEYHPNAGILPLMDEENLQKLAENICHYGLREDIVLFENKILDGRNRYRACLRSKIKPSFTQFAGTDPVAFVLSKNIHRRHLTKSQRAAIAADLLPMIEAEARRLKETAGEPVRDDNGQFAKEPEVEKIPPADEQADNKKSRDLAAEALGVNPRYVSEAKIIKQEAADLHEKVKKGTITLTQAKNELAKRKPKQVEAQPFTVILWDQSGEDSPMPDVLKDKKKRETFTNAVVFHLTGQPKVALACESKGGFRDAALFIVPVNAPKSKNEHSGLILQKPSCLFLVVRTCGEVPKPATVPDQVIKGGAVEARRMIEKMWPTAPRIISNGNGTPPEGWEVS